MALVRVICFCFDFVSLLGFSLFYDRQQEKLLLDIFRVCIVVDVSPVENMPNLVYFYTLVIGHDRLLQDDAQQTQQLSNIKSYFKQCTQFVGIFHIDSQARTTVKKNTYEPMWNEQIVFSELVIFLFYSWIVWHDRLFSVLAVQTLLQCIGHLQYFL